MAILINPNIIVEVFHVDIYRKETERRWQVPITKTKQIYEINNLRKECI
jgi:hypothetical protein